MAEKHIADAESIWRVCNINPDMCIVNGQVVPFEIYREQYQAFAYQHDLQATDADLQHTSETASKYKRANMLSAVEGMYVLRKTKDVNQALRKTQEVFGSYGFTVRQSY